MEGIVVSGAQVPQQLQLLQQQQQRPQGFNNYGAFVSQHPNLMYAARDVAFYPGDLSQYSVPTYAVPQSVDKPHGPTTSELGGKGDSEGPPAKSTRGGKKNAEKAGSTYASRHQAAESRRRQRINDRLEMLRKVVPHRDRANTAAFLEEVIGYVLGLKKRLAELEGVAEAELQIPVVDIQSALATGAQPLSSSGATVVGNPATSSMPISSEGTMAVQMGMPGNNMLAPMGSVLAQFPGDDGSGKSRNQVLVPVPLMHMDQGNGQQAYVLLNRDELQNASMIPQGVMHHPHVMQGGQPMATATPTAGPHPQGLHQMAQAPPPGEKSGGEHAHQEGLMGVLVGAADQVEGLPAPGAEEGDAGKDGGGDVAGDDATPAGPDPRTEAEEPAALEICGRALPKDG